MSMPRRRRNEANHSNTSGGSSGSTTAVTFISGISASHQAAHSQVPRWGITRIGPVPARTARSRASTPS